MTLCWHCDRMLDAMSALEDQADPEPGAISMCMYCGAIAIMGPDLELMQPTRADLEGLAKEDDFARAFVKFQWSRQLVMTESKLMGFEQEHSDGN